MEKATTSEKIEWIEQFENEIIPWTESLLEKELKHNFFLKDSKEKLVKKKDSFFPVWFLEARLNIDDIDDMIYNSDRMINHITSRIQEYKDYVKLKRQELCQ